jgi:glycosyltransferase involved in cell wall biosynthesis
MKVDSSSTNQWPRISIITPSFNQGNFIEETISSVISQGYPNLEYIIIDGGSTDNTLEVLKKIDSQVSFWISEKDSGQSEAINKGFCRASGEIIAWLNSDDYYLPGALFEVAKIMQNADWVVGGAVHIDNNRNIILNSSAKGHELQKFNNCFKNQNDFNFRIAQPSHFWSSKLIKDVGPLNETLHYAMDFELMLKSLALGYHPIIIEETLSCLRYHPNSKSKSINLVREFDLEWAKVLFKLGLSGYLKFFPSLIHACLYYARWLGGKSDQLFLENNKVLSLIFAFLGWMITPRKKGESFLSRIKRVLQF